MSSLKFRIDRIIEKALGIPFILILRILILGGLTLRFLIPNGTIYDLSFNDSNDGRYYICILIAFYVFLLLLHLALEHDKESVLFQDSRIRCFVVFSDILVITLFYLLTAKAQSDLFLFYFLPLAQASEYFKKRFLIATLAVVSIFFLGVLLLLYPIDTNLYVQNEEYSIVDLILRVFLVREFFYIAVVVVSLYLRQQEREKSEFLAIGARFSKSLLDFQKEIDTKQEVDDVIKLTLDKIVSELSPLEAFISIHDSNENRFAIRASYPESKFVLFEKIAECRNVGQSLLDNKHKSVESRFDSIKEEITENYYFFVLKMNEVLIGEIGILFPDYENPSEGILQFITNISNTSVRNIQRARLTTALHETYKISNRFFEIDLHLRKLLREISNIDCMGIAAVSLVDKSMQTVEMVKALNVPLGWMERSKYSLENDTDIIIDIVKSVGCAEIHGFDKRLNGEICERFDHSKLSRVFAPLMADGKAIGVIEGSCNLLIDRKFPPGIVSKMKQIGEEYGPYIADRIPSKQLELIASQAHKIVGAGSASIHIYKNGDEVLGAIAGRAKVGFLSMYKPRDNGLGFAAMRDGIVKVNNSSALHANNERIYDEGIRTIVAVPLGAIDESYKGVFYIHYWDEEHVFTEAEEHVVKLFAQQIEFALQGHLLVSQLREKELHMLQLPVMEELIASVVSGEGKNEVLDVIAKKLIQLLDVDNLVMHEYSDRDALCRGRPIIAGTFHFKNEVLEGAPDENFVQYILGEDSVFVEDVKRDPVFCGKRSGGSQKARFVDLERIRSCAAIPLKAESSIGNTEVVGIVFLNYRRPHVFTDDQRNSILTLASSIAVVIQTARLLQKQVEEIDRRRNERDILEEIVKEIIETDENVTSDKLYEKILRQGSKIFRCKRCYFMKNDELGGQFVCGPSIGLPFNDQGFKMPFDAGIVGLAAKDRKSISVDDVIDSKYGSNYLKVFSDTRSEMAIPVESGDRILGVFNFEHHDVGYFKTEDVIFAEMLAQQAVLAHHYTEQFEKVRRRFTPMMTLAEILSRVQDPKCGLDLAKRLLLTGVTAGREGGFSRAMLYLIEAGELKGDIAIGPLNNNEAVVVWTEHERKFSGYSEENRILELLKCLVESDSITDTKSQSVERIIGSIGVPLKFLEGSIRKCIDDVQTVSVLPDQIDYYREKISETTKGLITYENVSYACIPIVCDQSKTIGVIVVDNSFKFSERKEINDDDLKNAEAIANVLAITIEKFQYLDDKVAKERYNAAVKFTSGIGHVLGTHIVRIVSPLESMIKLKEKGKMTDELFFDRLKEAESAIEFTDMTLDLLRRFGDPKSDRLDLESFRKIIDEIAEQSKPEIEVEWKSSREEAYMKCDSNELKTAFYTLVENSLWACKIADVEPVLRIKVCDQNSGEPSKEGGLEVLFLDNGIGIPLEDKTKIFEPGFSTKKVEGTEAAGTGLGLAIVKKTIQNHGGDIVEIGKDREGAVFKIILPLM